MPLKRSDASTNSRSRKTDRIERALPVHMVRTSTMIQQGAAGLKDRNQHEQDR